MIILLVKYECKENKAKEFLEKIGELKIDINSRNENGNIRYDYAFDQKDSNVVLLTEIWESQAAIEAHKATEHFAKLGEIKSEYMVNTVIDKYEAMKL